MVNQYSQDYDGDSFYLSKTHNVSLSYILEYYASEIANELIVIVYRDYKMIILKDIDCISYTVFVEEDNINENYVYDLIKVWEIK